MGWEAEPGYRAYMLRLRRTDGAQARWLASLDEVSTGERHTFASMDALVTFLREQTGRTTDADPGDSTGEPSTNSEAMDTAERRGL